jgi:hypothetical protein
MDRLPPTIGIRTCPRLSLPTLPNTPMTDSFDPYYKWLGIPPDEQPADHYRLFGLRLFESDPEVIDNAATQRMSHLRTFHLGQRSQRSQEMLNELSAARSCLLDVEKKSAYDDSLRRVTEPACPLPPACDFLPPPIPSPMASAQADPDAASETSLPAPVATVEAPPPAADLPLAILSDAPKTTPPGLAPSVPMAMNSAPAAAPEGTRGLETAHVVSPALPAAGTFVHSPAPEPASNSMSVAPPSQISEPGTQAPPDEEHEPPRKMWLRSASSILLSAAAHLLLFVVLALWAFPELAREPLKNLLVLEIPKPSADQLITSDLIEIESETAVSLAKTDPLAGLDTSVSVVDVDEALLDASYNEREDISPLALEGPLLDGTEIENILGEIQVGGLGESHAIVDDYQQALDRITREVMMMSRDDKLLLVWLFDQSASMKDDQQEIHDRIDNIYSELSEQEGISGMAIETAVASFGEGFLLNTSAPTTHFVEVQDAIRNVPDDPSGKEMMCQAVLRVMGTYAAYVKANDRKLAIIVVTDEAGEAADNQQFLEPAIAQAKANDCRIYVLGREASFGSPYAKMRWVHPINGAEYWLPVDRGPESAFVEQLQTDGFGKRIDVHPSGFGPYGQCRLAKESGGVFFMLPSQEVNLVRGEARRFELRVLSDYRPDLRSRWEVAESSSKDRLRIVLTKVINDINPYREEVADITEIRREFSAEPLEFLKQAVQEKKKAVTYLSYLDAAIKELEKIRPMREAEESLRWQANYDLAYGQLLAYAARTYEYIATIDDFVKKPSKVPIVKPTEDDREGHLELARWRVHLSDTTIERGFTSDLIDRSTIVFRELIEEHEGTPWAARAEWELSRGFGVRLADEYRYVRPPRPKPPAAAAGVGNAGGKVRPKPRRAKPAPPPVPEIVIPKAL